MAAAGLSGTKFNLIMFGMGAVAAAITYRVIKSEWDNWFQKVDREIQEKLKVQS